MVIIFFFVAVVLLVGYEIYASFSGRKNIGEYSKYSADISDEFDVELIKEIYNRQSKVLVKSEDINPTK